MWFGFLMLDCYTGVEQVRSICIDLCEKRLKQQYLSVDTYKRDLYHISYFTVEKYMNKHYFYSNVKIFIQTPQNYLRLYFHACCVSI